MRKLLQRLWDIAADFANFMGGLGMRLVWLPKLHFSPGAEHVRTDPGPALFVLNHSWWMDAPMLCLLCRRRRISVVAAGEMFTGVRSLAMRSLRCIPVDRATGADLSFFHEALRRLRAGRCVAIFPEGALNPTETLLPFKQRRGAGHPRLQRGELSAVPAAAAPVRRSHRADAAAERRGRAGGDAVPAGGHGAPAGGALSGDETEISDARGGIPPPLPGNNAPAAAGAAKRREKS